MKRFILAFAAATVLGACEVQFPVTGELEGVPAQGTTVAKLPEGTFSVSNTRGLNCTGTYNSTTTDITLTAPVVCNDGRTGTALITRKTNLLAGTVLVRLDDGSEGRFVFGDLSFSEEFR